MNLAAKERKELKNRYLDAMKPVLKTHLQGDFYSVLIKNVATNACVFAAKERKDHKESLGRIIVLCVLCVLCVLSRLLDYLKCSKIDVIAALYRSHQGIFAIFAFLCGYSCFLPG